MPQPAEHDREGDRAERRSTATELAVDDDRIVSVAVGQQSELASIRSIRLSLGGQRNTDVAEGVSLLLRLHRGS